MTETLPATASADGEPDLRVAYLGPAGTFSHAAAQAKFGRTARYVACADHEDVFRTVEGGDAGYAVVPVENVIEGAVTRNLDLAAQSALCACGEIELRVRQNLLRSVPGVQGIQRIYSHPQSFAQTSVWLATHLAGVERVAVCSNAEAARLAAADAASAAVAGRAAAQEYGLVLVKADIENVRNNRTRFVVFGQEPAERTERDRTWLVITLPEGAEDPAALVRAICPFAVFSIPVLRLDTRPQQGNEHRRTWGFALHLLVEGHQQDPRLAAAIAEIARASRVRVIGSFAAGALTG